MIATPRRLAAAFTAVAATAVVPAVLASMSAAATARPQAAAAPTKILLRHTSLGMILTTGSGRTVYAFTKDGKNRDRCASISGCKSIWPPVTTHGRPAAGPGVKGSLLGTIKLAGGSVQITYAGHPLYRYSADTSAGETDYVGAAQFGGTWKAVKSSGALVG